MNTQRKTMVPAACEPPAVLINGPREPALTLVARGYTMLPNGRRAALNKAGLDTRVVCYGRLVRIATPGVKIIFITDILLEVMGEG